MAGGPPSCTARRAGDTGMTVTCGMTVYPGGYPDRVPGTGYPCCTVPSDSCLVDWVLIGLN